MNDKETFKTSNKNDYKPINISEDELANFQRNYIPRPIKNDITANDSEITTNIHSIYELSMKSPKNQPKLYDYDKIKFKEDKKIVDTITQEIKDKDTNIWSFDYFNSDKNKDHKYNPFQIRSINSRLDLRMRNKNYRENKQIWDPIANRFFQAKIDNDIKIENLKKEN